jgi:hypothetical protein
MTLARPFSLILMFVLFGCETSPEKPNIIEFLPFDQAAATLSGALSDQLASNQSLLEKIGESTVVVDEMIDADTGEATEATKRVQDYLLATSRQRKFNIACDFRRLAQANMCNRHHQVRDGPRALR